MTPRILVVDDSPTIRKVVSSILERNGYEATVASDGQDALDRLADTEAPFDLILLDFVMPRMNGYQFCRALRGRDDAKEVPIVLMSAKSDKIRDQFVTQTGAIDAITKPFDAQALVAVIDNAIRRSTEWKARGEALSAGILHDDLADTTDSMRAPPTLADGEARRIRVTHEYVKRLAGLITPVLAASRSDGELDEARVAGVLTAGVPPDQLRELADWLRAIDFGDGATLALSGDISIIPIGAILQLCQIEAQTGILIVSNGKTEVYIAMRSGLIDLVQARNAGQEFRLGRYFMEHGLLTPSDIDGALREQRSPDKSGPASAAAGATPPTLRDAASGNGPPLGARFSAESPSSLQPRLLGDVLVDSGRVSKDQLRDALARQSSELVYEILRWQNGRFEFRRDIPPPLAESAQLALPVASVVMEGFRRVDEWRLIEVGVGSFEAVLQRDLVAVDALGQGRLDRAERALLDVIDGERTVREVIAAAHMSSFDACKIIFQLIEARLVRRRAA